MNKLRLILKYIFTVLFVFAVGRATYRFLLDCDGIVVQQVEESLFSVDSKIERIVADHEVFASVSGIYYDYNVMIDFIDLAEEIKREASASFEDPEKKRTIDIEVVSALLTQLLRERGKLRNYIWDLEGHSRAGISYKKGRNLRYYQQVIEDAIIAMRDLLQKKQKKQNKK